MQFKIYPFEIRHRHLPTKKGVILKQEGRLSEVAPLPGRSRESLEMALEQLTALQQGKLHPDDSRLYPSVQFGLYGLQAPPILSTPCALFLHGSPQEILQHSDTHREFKIAKIKVGHWTVEQAREVIHQLPFRLRIDFNHQWTPSDVEQLCCDLNPSQIEFLEDPGCSIPGFKIASDEKGAPSELLVWKPMIRGLPPRKKLLILSSSLESSIGLHHIASLCSSNQIPPHSLGIGTVLNLEKDLVKNGAFLKDGSIHFPSSWELYTNEFKS